MTKVIAWNIAGHAEAWQRLASSDADIALLQEAREPPTAVATKIAVDAAPWQTGASRKWRTAVVGLSNRVALQRFETKPLGDAREGEIGVSRPGTLSAAIVTPSSGEAFLALSIYGAWEEPHPSTPGKFIYADASVHRLISDLSVFIGKRGNRDILVAGDLNILYGYGENGDEYWGRRYDTVFDRMAALNLEFVGPQAPHGRIAEPWPAELPRTSKNVPTYYTKRQSPTTCTRQLDFVFASRGLAKRLHVRALNGQEEWGPSDHCQVEIEID